MKSKSFEELIMLDNKSLSSEEHQQLLNNPNYEYSYYLGETKYGEGWFEIELKDGSTFEIKVVNLV